MLSAISRSSISKPYSKKLKSTRQFTISLSCIEKKKTYLVTINSFLLILLVFWKVLQSSSMASLVQVPKFLSWPELCRPQTSHPLYHKPKNINTQNCTICSIMMSIKTMSLPLFTLKSSKNRRSLVLLAHSMFTISVGLFWLATKSCKMTQKR